MGMRGTGKPRKGRSKVSTQLYFEPEQLKWLHTEAKRRRSSAAEIVRDAVDAERLRTSEDRRAQGGT